MRVGNFSVLPFIRLSQLVVVPEIWNHYAAAVIRSRLPFRSLRIARGRRYSGRSKMDFIGLLLHGEYLLLDFSERPFDPIEFGRMLAVADQLVRVV